MAVYATSIDGPDVERPSGGRRMARQHVNVALLAQHVSPSSQKLRIIRAMRRVTVHTILARRRMLPQKRSPLFRMAGVANVIGRMFHKHLAAATAMRIVAGSATDLHVAMLRTKQVCRALRKCFAFIGVASQTSFLDTKRREHVLRLFHFESVQIRPSDL